MFRSTFITKHATVESSTSDRIVKLNRFLLIFDLDEGMSVTNDVENVLRTLRDERELRPGMRVIYRDTEGVFDEIVIDEQCEFIGFRSLGEHDERLALSKAVSMRHYQ